MEKNQKVRCKKPFENWLRVSGSKLNVSVLDLKKMALLIDTVQKGNSWALQGEWQILYFLAILMSWINDFLDSIKHISFMLLRKLSIVIRPIFSIRNNYVKIRPSLLRLSRIKAINPSQSSSSTASRYGVCNVNIENSTIPKLQMSDLIIFIEIFSR